MNNLTGTNKSPFQPYQPKRWREFDLCFCKAINTDSGNLPQVVKYRAITNKDQSEVILAGAELLAHIKQVCGTLNVYSVLARMSFFPVDTNEGTN